MSSRASTSRSQGCTPRFAQPPISMLAVASSIIFRMAILCSRAGSGKQVSDRGLFLVLRGIAKSQVCFDQLAGAIEHIGAGHAFHFELLCEGALRIENDF